MRGVTRIIHTLAAVLALLCSNSASAQITDTMREWLRRIDSVEFRPSPSVTGEWVEEGSYYQRSERNSAGADEIVRYDPATGGREVWMTAEQLKPKELGRSVGTRFASASTNRTVLLFQVNPRSAGMRNTAYECWVTDRANGSWRKLGGKSKSGLVNAKLSPDGSHAAYVRDQNLFVEKIATGAIHQLTRDGGGPILNGLTDWVYNEEFGLLDGFKWSPDGKWLAYFQFDERSVPEFSLINYTDSMYPKITKYPYPKTGQTNPAVRVGIVSASGGKTRWAQTATDTRNNYIPRIEWAPDSRDLLLQNLNRLQNTNRYLLIEARTGKARELFRDEDKAWVDINERMIWLEQGNRLLIDSERDGWRHAYSISRTGEARQITTEPFDLLQVAGVDEKGGWLYYTASPDNATQTYLYRSSLDGAGKTERITPAGHEGWNSYTLSPDCRHAFHTHSQFASPGVTELVRLPDHSVVKTIQENKDLREKVTALLKDRTEFVKVDVGDGAKLDGWIIRPTQFDASKKYPVVVYVYGEPYSQTVTDRWNGASTLRYAALADEGYLVMSFDNRGVNLPKGRDWRKVIYGRIGELASKEQASALRSLAESHPYVDLTRVGVFGWSGGGSMTQNLLFRHPDLFKVGVAGAGVPDQTLYDSIYQERYMGLPNDNAEGYRVGSPINFADGLKGKLLIVHGTGDDNVHFQGTQRLLNKLIELNKQFDFMEYPNRNHGIGGNHLHTLTYGYFMEHLPAGGR